MTVDFINKLRPLIFVDEEKIKDNTKIDLQY